MPVITISKIGLSTLINSKDILWASKWLFAALIQKLNPAHKKNKAKNPATNDKPAFWGMANATAKPAIAITHHGKKRHKAKLNDAINTVEIKNFIGCNLKF